MKAGSCLHFITLLILFSLLFPDTASCATQPDTTFSTTLRVIWGLLVVLGILFIIYGLMKKKMSFLNMQGKGLIKIVEARHLMPKKSLYLVEVRGQEFLLGTGQDGINLIASIRPGSKGSFAEILENSESEGVK
jgi:flagellar protein FliO/FliZ